MISKRKHKNLLLLAKLAQTLFQVGNLKSCNCKLTTYVGTETSQGITAVALSHTNKRFLAVAERGER